MRYLSGNDEKNALNFLNLAIDVAKNSTCSRSKCGCVIVNSNKVIGTGFNSPPQNNIKQKRCSNSKDLYHNKVTDKTCCVHAEQRAIIDALKNNSNELIGSRLYFIRLDDDNHPMHAGEPYCTICSKMALDVGISEFVLWNANGFCIYDTQEYNLISFQYGLKP